ncbi:polyamine ABC transporter substrate-binding protein [Nocardioides anomalus]|nr:spermidine/putrescine ABC transporter substrate-binding protein [Nocardioides anomalus]
MTATPYLSRRALVGAAAGTALSTSACAYIDPPGPDPLPTKRIVPEVDGDLVYFNWADYVHPKVMKGFQEEYGVKVVQSNFDSMESMQAKLAAGNRYDVIFPSAQWVQKLTAANKLYPIDHSVLTNAPAIFDHYDYFADPWYDPGSAHSVPFTMYKTGIAWRKDQLGDELTGSWRDLWDDDARDHTFVLDDRDEVLGMAALLLGLPLNTSDVHELDRIVETMGTLRPYLRAFSSDDYLNLLGGDAWLQQTWSGDMAAVLWQADDPGLYGFESPSEGTPVNSDTYAIPANAEHPGTALLFIDYMLRPEVAAKNIGYIGYPMPIHGTEEVYDDLIASYPACKVTLEDLAGGHYFTGGSVESTRVRDAAYTEIKVG